MKQQQYDLRPLVVDAVKAACRAQEAAAGPQHVPENPRDVPESVAVAQAAYTIDGFCAAHHLSKSLLFSLWREGRGPRRMVMGRVVRITAEAAAEWRREIEAFPCGASTEWTPEARERLRGSPKQAA